jgi:predicted nucleic acid-binding protein
LDLADRFALPAAYDAHYLALADWLGGEFWTADRRLAKAVGEALPWVRLVEI